MWPAIRCIGQVEVRERPATAVCVVGGVPEQPVGLVRTTPVDPSVFLYPETDSSHSMRRMHCISRDHRFIDRQLVQQCFIAPDKCCLLRRVQLARDRRRLAMFHRQAM